MIWWWRDGTAAMCILIDDVLIVDVGYFFEW